MDRQDKLNVIADELQYWLDHNDSRQLEALGKDRRKENTDEI